ncbi:phosphatase PAP2 family protein [Halalkalicoccus sp. NIPERK01]|uniref:phosphatase PAP2 family protein n=1 Tax=Halalkalicoccus sp. NIPERK01 TaxID=3053469 RepID=UPI00256F0D32|nr:phosphatase PAP2 family protein [Halalkalicoccus sp. NIPERK01]MDL5361158.1 phosphatase PAP2 family protein [Halalkalicoccus sp. NIPERK01]
MFRGVGEFEPVQGAIPDSLAILVALLTQLGDVWFVTLLFLVLAVRYDGFDRDRIVAAGGLVIGAIALVLLLKDVFALPRPDQPLVALEALWVPFQLVYSLTAYASGYGFPSGHAVVSTATYLSLAAVLPVSTRRRRYAVATALIAVVGFCRIALGVHYLVDVLAGIALSAVFLLLAFRLLARYRSSGARRTVALGLGAALALAAVVVTGAHVEALALFAVAIGLFGLSWRADRPRVAA